MYLLYEDLINFNSFKEIIYPTLGPLFSLVEISNNQCTPPLLNFSELQTDYHIFLIDHSRITNDQFKENEHA